MVLVQSAPGDLSDVLAVSAACVICPFLLLGDFAGPRNSAVLAVLVGVAAVAALAGFWTIRGRDYTLAETV
jgi:hypothetical protein